MKLFIPCLACLLPLILPCLPAAAQRSIFEDDAPAARTPPPPGADVALGRQVVEKLSRTQYNLWQHRVKDFQVTYALLREGEVAGQAVISCAGPGQAVQVKLEGDRLEEADRKRLPTLLEYALNNALFYHWGGDVAAEKTATGFRLRPRQGGDENTRDISETYHLTRAVMTAGEGRVEIDYAFQTIRGIHYLDTMTMITSRGRHRTRQAAVYTYARHDGVPVVSKLSLTVDNPDTDRTIAEYRLQDARFRLSKVGDGRFDGLTDEPPPHPDRPPVVIRPDEPPVRHDRPPVIIRPDEPRPRPDGEHRPPPRRRDPMEAIRSIGAWDQATQELVPRLLEANLGAHVLPLIYKSAQYTVDVQIAPQSIEVITSRLNVSWEDVDGDGLLSDAEVTVDVASVSSPIGRALIREVADRFRRGLSQSVPAVLSTANVKTRRTREGYLMTVKSRDGMDFQVTVSEDFRITHIQGESPALGATSTVTNTFSKVGDKWLLKESTEKVTARNAHQVTTASLQYESLDGLPVANRVSNLKTVSTLGARYSVREDYACGKMTLKKRERPLHPLLAIAKASGVDIAPYDVVGDEGGGDVHFPDRPPSPRPPDDQPRPRPPDHARPEPRREGNWLYYHTMAGMAMNRQKYDEALGHLNKGLQEQPDHPKLIGGRGDCYMKMEEYDKALAEYNRVIELAPDIADGYTGRCVVYCRQSKIKQAYEDADKAVKVAPQDPEGYRLRALVGMYRLEYDQCWKDVKTCRHLGGKVTDSFIKELERCSGKKDQKD